jgi:signal transduction histidine kinase
MTENKQITDFSRLALDVYFESKKKYASTPKLNFHFRDQSTSSCLVEADQIGIRFAISNLVANAINASGETGEIFIELRKQGWKCMLDVVDYGHGPHPEIETAAIKKAFGVLGIESMHGQGTRARIELPLAN